MLAARLLLFGLALAGSAHACWTTSLPEVDVAIGPAGRYYVDNDCPSLTSGECIFSVWSYQESNGLPGLQRLDEVKDDTCGQIASDVRLLP